MSNPIHGARVRVPFVELPSTSGLRHWINAKKVNHVEPKEVDASGFGKFIVWIDLGEGFEVEAQDVALIGLLAFAAGEEVR